MTPTDELRTRAILDLPGIADYLGTTERHIRSLVFQRDIPYVKVGRLLRFRLSDIDAWLSDNTVEAGSPVPSIDTAVARVRAKAQAERS